MVLIAGLSLCLLTSCSTLSPNHTRDVAADSTEAGRLSIREHMRSEVYLQARPRTVLTKSFDGRHRLSMEVAAQWVTIREEEISRIAAFFLPAPGEELPVGRLSVYWFGSFGAGTVMDNLENWAGELDTGMEHPLDQARVSQTPVFGYTLTQISAEGHRSVFEDPQSGTAATNPEAEVTASPLVTDWALEAAVLETPEGPIYVKAEGPAETIRWNRPAIQSFYQSLQTEQIPGEEH